MVISLNATYLILSPYQYFLQAEVLRPVSVLPAVLASASAGVPLHPHLLDHGPHRGLRVAEIHSTLLKPGSLYFFLCWKTMEI